MNNATLLLRQVHPSWVQEGRVTSQIFKPTPKDAKRLSVYDGDKITPENAWKHYTNELNHRSVGILAVTVEECENYQLTVEPDPDLFPEHVIINFESCRSNSQIEKKAKQLKKAAVDRDWQYLVPNESEH